MTDLARPSLARIVVALVPVAACAAPPHHAEEPGSARAEDAGPASVRLGASAEDDAALEDAPPPLVPSVPMVRVGRARRTSGEGELDEAAARQALARRIGALSTCYRAALEVQPDLQARGAATIAIDEAGAAAAVEVSGFGTDEAPAACVRTALSALRLPPPAGGALVLSVEIAFRLGP